MVSPHVMAKMLLEIQRGNIHG